MTTIIKCNMCEKVLPPIPRCQEDEGYELATRNIRDVQPGLAGFMIRPNSHFCVACLKILSSTIKKR